MINTYDLSVVLKDTAGTDGYYCSENAETSLSRLSKNASDKELHEAANLFRNREKRLPEVCVKDEKLQARWDEALKDFLNIPMSSTEGVF